MTYQPRKKSHRNKGWSPYSVGVVYLLEFFTGVHAGRYKIGLSAFLPKRLHGLRSTYGDTFYVNHTIQTDDMYGLEARLHQLFADKEVAHEIFELDSADICQIINWTD